MQNIHRAERIVSPEHIRVKAVREYPDLFRSCRLSRGLEPPSRAGHEIPYFLRGPDDDRSVSGRLIADHVSRIRSSRIR